MSTPKTQYTSPEDWELWSNEFRRKARSHNVWQFIDPSTRQEWPIAPVRPSYSDYPKKGSRQTTRNQSHSQPSGSDTIVVPGSHDNDDIDLSNHPSCISEMTAEGKADYQHDWNTYIFLEKQYDKFRSSILTLTDWVLNTVSETYKLTICHEDKNLAEWYRTLEETGKVHEHRLKGEARDRYRASVKPLTKLPRDFDAWVRQWETAMAYGIQKKVADTLDSQTWAEDLMTALRGVLENWTITFQMTNQTSINNNKLDYRLVAAALRDHIRIVNKSTPGTRVTKGAFAAKYGREDDTADNHEPSPDSPTQSMPNNLTGKKQGNKAYRHPQKKRKRSEPDTSFNSPTCQACSGFHELAQCFYVFPKKAPSGWRKNRVLERLVQDRLKDQTLEEEIFRITKKKDATIPDQD
ncbi:hypothetical protein RB595_004825 [Gaeumannomyces hyphopodioides]